jgi:hypothetical protein
MRISIRQDSKGSFLEFMKDFEKQLIELPLRGISNIKQVEVSESNIIKYNEDGSFNTTKEWVLKTSGSNLLDILGDDVVDITRTITNDIIEFHEIFGIEATRELIYRELNKVYSGKNPNPRHIQMLSDIMTYRGKLMQIDRHGLNKNPELGPIAKASFEEVMNNFTKAALFAEKDNMKGVSANILAGQFCKSGTNSFEILIDEDKLLEEVEVPNYVESEFVNINEKDVEKAFSNTYSSYEPTEDVQDSDFNFGFGIEEKKEFLLKKIDTSELVIINKENNNNTPNNQINFEKIEIEEPNNLENNEKNSNVENGNIENGNVENGNLNIDFNEIDIEEPNEEKLEKKDKKNNKKETKSKVVKIKKTTTKKNVKKEEENNK